ncbi:hypothetical protein GBA52_010355 [Prunus armeniaca]|nr:hypothetical protein GBA52_010355 [Prunus armeniaca]
MTSKTSLVLDLGPDQSSWDPPTPLGAWAPTSSFDDDTCTNQPNQKSECVQEESEPRKSIRASFDVITEILSCLPVDSLLRFRCVCKQWFSLFQDLQFIAKHMDRVRPLQFSYALIKQETKKLEAVVDENFKVLEVCSGLFLEKSLNSQVCRIRNPATHQVLYLPNAHDRAEIKDFVFNPSTHECKVVCVGEAGFQVITVGKDEQWRPLKRPNQDVPQQHSKKALNVKYLKATNKAEGIGHLVIFIVDRNNLCLEIQSLDIWNECFTTTAVPRGFLVDLRKVLISYWNQCVAFAEIAEGKFNMFGVRGREGAQME